MWETEFIKHAGFPPLTAKRRVPVTKAETHTQCGIQSDGLVASRTPWLAQGSVSNVSLMLLNISNAYKHIHTCMGKHTQSNVQSLFIHSALTLRHMQKKFTETKTAVPGFVPCECAMRSN